jgi:hypothetical protein
MLLGFEAVENQQADAKYDCGVSEVECGPVIPGDMEIQEIGDRTTAHTALAAKSVLA